MATTATTAFSRRNRGEQARTRRADRTATKRRDRSLEGLSSGAIYDLALHGHQGARALLGSALDVTASNAMDVRRLVQPWQAESMSYYELVPEHKFAARFMGALLSRVRLFPALIDDKTGEPEEVTDGPIWEAFQRIRDRNGGMSQLQQSYGTLKYLIGETYLTVSPDHDRGEVWECLSPNELRVQPGGIATRFRAPMLSADQYQIGAISPEKYVIGNERETIQKNGGEPLDVGFGVATGPEFADHGPDVIVVYRLWRPSPAYSWLADSNSHASLGLLEELVLSQASVRSQLKSRLYQAGVLAIPEGLSFPSAGNNPDEDSNSDIFQQRLTNAIMTAIGDPGSAAGLSPIVLEVAGEFIKDLRYIKFNDNQGELAEISQRAEMIERYGVGQELPPELFSSKADMNHWTGWLVDRTTWDSYGLPGSLEMASDINASYLQPAMMEEKGVDWTKVMIGIDPAEVINHPNRSQDAQAAFDRLQISGKVYREQLGFNDNDVMSQEEKDEQAGLKIKDGSLYRFGIPAVRANIEPEAGEVEGAPADATNPDTGGANAPGPPKEKVVGPASGKAPNTGPDDTQGGPAVTASGEGMSMRILGAAEFAVQRGRELAGSRLRSMTTGRNAARCEECAAAIEGVARWEVASVLGEARVVELFSVEAPALVDGTGVAFAAVLEGMGVAKRWAAELGELVERHTAGTLYKPMPDPLPAGFMRLLARVDRPLERT